MLCLVCGLPGSGKTTLARAFAGRFGWRHLNSDSVRSALDLRGHYAEADKQRVYDALLGETAALLQAGENVVVDSTFYREDIRRPFVEAARATGTPVKWVEITAPEAVVRERLRRPRADSEAGWEVYRKIRAAFEPLPAGRLVLDSGRQPAEAMLDAMDQYLNHG